jgi:hypothetical protein
MLDSQRDQIESDKTAKEIPDRLVSNTSMQEGRERGTGRYYSQENFVNLTILSEIRTE